MLYTYVSITYSYFQGILYSFYFINCMEVTVHTPLFREVFWHEYAKIPRHTAQIYAISINYVHREACYCERSEP